MAKTSGKLGSARRFGTRYGRTVKHNLAKIEEDARNSTTCPHCLYPMAHRLAVGIFSCRKCGKKFTSKAYTISPITSVMETLKNREVEFSEEPAEAEEELEETEAT